MTRRRVVRPGFLKRTLYGFKEFCSERTRAVLERGARLSVGAGDLSKAKGEDRILGETRNMCEAASARKTVVFQGRPREAAVLKGLLGRATR